MAEFPEIVPERILTPEELAEQQRQFAQALVADLKSTRFAMLAAASQCAREAYALVARESPNVDRIGRLVEITSKALGAAEAAGRLCGSGQPGAIRDGDPVSSFRSAE